MKYQFLLISASLVVAACTPVPIGNANPLDRSGDEKSAATLHEENVQEITSNPGYRLP